MASEEDFLALDSSPLRRNGSYHCIRLSYTCHQYVRGGCRAPDCPPVRHIGRAQSISIRHQMAAFAVHSSLKLVACPRIVTPDVVLASVYLAACGIAHDTPSGDARCVGHFSKSSSVDLKPACHATHPRVAYHALATAAGLQLEHYATVASYEAV